MTCVMVLLFVMGSIGIQAEEQYFPAGNDAWKVIAPSDAGWDSGKLQLALDYAGKHQSSGVVVLYRGRIMAEQYWQPPAKKIKPNGQPSKYGFRMLGKDARKGHKGQANGRKTKGQAKERIGVSL